MIIKNAEIWWMKCDPKRPVELFKNDDGSKVMGWEIELRTTDKKTAMFWKTELGAKQVVRAVREDKDDEESPILYWKWKLRKKQFNANGEPTDPVEVVRGDTGEPLDQGIVGNKSIGHVRVYDRHFQHDGIDKVAFYLQAVAVQKLVKYEGGEKEDFEYGGEMEVVDAEGNDRDYGNEDQEQKAKKTKASRRKRNEGIDDDEIPF